MSRCEAPSTSCERMRGVPWTTRLEAPFRLTRSDSDTASSIVDAPLELDAPTHVRAGQPIQLTVHGTPGDLVLLANSAQTRWVFDPLYEGVFLFGPSARRTLLGTIPPSGTLTYPLSTTLLPPGVLAAHRVLQLVARHPSGQIELGGAAFVTILDPAF